MSTTKRQVPIAQQAAEWLRLFRGGVFEDNFLDVSRLDAEAFELARAMLAEAKLLTVEWDVPLAGRPYLRLPEPKEPAPPAGPIDAVVRVRFVEAYRSLMMAVRQAFHGPHPKQGMDIMLREEANFRRAVRWALDLGDTEKAAEMANTVTRYLGRASRTEDRDAWVAWLAGEAPCEADAAAIAEEAAMKEARAPVAKEEPPKPPAPPVASTPAHPEPKPPAPLVAEAAPEPPAPVEAKETEGARLQREGAQLQREGTAAVAEGQIAKATELYLGALRCFQDARDAAGVAATCELFGAMEEAAGRPDGARVWYGRAAAKRAGGKGGSPT